MDAQRVPPSACRTSQSMVICRSPSFHRRAEGASDQALDLGGARIKLQLLDVAVLPLGRAGGEHRILRRHPALSGILQERRHLLAHARRAEDPGVPPLDQNRSRRILREVPDDLNLAQFRRPLHSTVHLHLSPTPNPYSAQLSAVSQTFTATSPGIRAFRSLKNSFARFSAVERNGMATVRMPFFSTTAAISRSPTDSVL